VSIKSAKILFIAKVCHDANKSYCETLGDTSQPLWDFAPEWQRDSAYNGVKFRLENPGVTPEQMHHNWAKEKLADGWVYGRVKDPKAKTHPCLVDYASLPPEQQVKDALFSAIVGALSSKEGA